MKFIADFHIHSRFSIATSKQMRLGPLHAWAQRKGLAVVGTGDFTHPQWAAELHAQLVPAEEGLHRLTPELAREVERDVPPSCRREVRFVVTAEISNIYKKKGKTRRVHNLIFAPDLDTAGRISVALGKIGNIASDGRPILGLDSRDLLHVVIEESGGRAFLVPAHAWTPHFSVLGAFSDFGSIEECYEDLTPHVFAIESGLSLDPAMYWRLSALDRFALISNSDAHSPEKLGREANLFDADLSFGGIVTALKRNDGRAFLGTIEFFPQKGKYHYDGHRACGVRLSPADTRRCGGLCPVCGRKVTLGVHHRVDELADRPEGFKPPRALPFQRLIPLKELLSEVMSVGPASKRVACAYDSMLTQLGSELHILREVSAAQIKEAGIPNLAQVIARVRNGDVHIAPGFDGQFGSVKVLG